MYCEFQFCKIPFLAAVLSDGLPAGFGPELYDGQLHAVLDDAGADGVAGEAGGVVDVELLHEMFAVLLDGLDADAQFRRGLLIGFSFRDELQHFHLARGHLDNFIFDLSRAVWRFWIETVMTPGNGGAEKCVS